MSNKLYWRIQTRGLKKEYALKLAVGFVRDGIPAEQTQVINEPRTDKWRVLRKLNDEIIENDIEPREYSKYMASLLIDTDKVQSWRRKLKRSQIIRMTGYLQ